MSDRPVALLEAPLSAIRAATGLSTSAASKIRNGYLIPHRRHWPALHTPSHHRDDGDVIRARTRP